MCSHRAASPASRPAVPAPHSNVANRGDDAAAGDPARRDAAVHRVVDMPEDIRLDQLHRVLQVAMGSDSHLHQFVAGDRRYGFADEDAPPDEQDETAARSRNCQPLSFTCTTSVTDGPTTSSAWVRLRTGPAALLEPAAARPRTVAASTGTRTCCKRWLTLNIQSTASSPNGWATSSSRSTATESMSEYARSSVPVAAAAGATRLNKQPRRRRHARPNAQRAEAVIEVNAQRSAIVAAHEPRSA